VNYSASLTAPSVALPAGTKITEEKLTGTSQGGVATPKWKNERRYIQSFGESLQYLGKLAAATFFLSITDKYRNDPFVKAHSDHPEFKAQIQYFVLDPTDAVFLRDGRG